MRKLSTIKIILAIAIGIIIAQIVMMFMLAVLTPKNMIEKSTPNVEQTTAPRK